LPLLIQQFLRHPLCYSSAFLDNQGSEGGITVKAKILVVEDDAGQRLLYLRELSAAGYFVQTAATGQEALQLFETGAPDLVVLDIRMPDSDGIETMGRILARNRHIPIILHSAYGCYRDNYLTWAADAYLTKSADLQNLKDTIKALLAARPDKFVRAEKRTGRRNEQEGSRGAGSNSKKINSAENW